MPFSLYFYGPSYLTVAWFGDWDFASGSFENLDCRGDDFKNKVSVFSARLVLTGNTGSGVHLEGLANKGDDFKKMLSYSAHSWQRVQRKY